MTTHWASFDNLALFGARPVQRRVVVDRNRLPPAASPGRRRHRRDLFRPVAAILSDTATAQAIQLMIEYDPDPPFHVGSPDRAPADLVISVKAMMAPMLAERRAPCERAAARLKRH